VVEDLAKEGEASGIDQWREDQKNVHYPQSVGMVEKAWLMAKPSGSSSQVSQTN
jgi:hypothetical protein